MSLTTQLKQPNIGKFLSFQIFLSFEISDKEIEKITPFLGQSLSFHLTGVTEEATVCNCLFLSF